MKKSMVVSAACTLAAFLAQSQPILDTGKTYSFGPGKGKSFVVPLKPEWGVLTLKTRMKTTGLVRGDKGWKDGRIPMSFHDANGKMVGGWPNVFGFSGTMDWTDCERDFKIPVGAVRLNISVHNLGSEGTAEYAPLTLEVKRNRAIDPCNVPLPEGAPADPWGLDDAWKVSTATRTRWSLNGLWGLRPPAASREGEVPGPNDNWGWGKIPSVWNSNDQMKLVSDWFEDHDQSSGISDSCWYRRDFTMPHEVAGRRVVLTFTMLQTHATVYVDGKRAAEVAFPGGEADITAFAKPGKKQSLVLFVTSYPLNETTLDFNAPDRAMAGKSEIKFKGITGDVYLDAVAQSSPHVDDATVETGDGEGKITFVADCAGTSKPVRLAVRVYDTADVTAVSAMKPIRSFESGAIMPDAEGRIAFAASWPDAKRWDIHTPSNLYVCAMELRDRDGGVLDAALPFTFGVRTVRTSGRNLLLNGTPVHLRALYNRTMNATAGEACLATARELCRRLNDEGFNFIIAGNYNFSPGAVSYMDAILQACDETGTLFSFSLPHLRDFSFKMDDPAVAERYRVLARWVIRRARNHPSVITYAMNHNATGYIGDMNPLRIDGRYAPEKLSLRFRNRRQAKICSEIARSIDGTRPIYHHESGNLDDFHTVNIYLNWSPVQERSDWLHHWSATGEKPLFFVEWGMPHISSWSSYRGPLFIWRKRGYQSLWASEFAAAFRGDAAYEGDTSQNIDALCHEEKLWARGEPFFWSGLNMPLKTMDANYSGVQATYMSDNWRSHRAWGITAMLPWDQEALHRKVAQHAQNKENPQRWTGLKNPGIVPDTIKDDGWSKGTGEAANYVRTPAGEVLARWNAFDCAFIGGDGIFTDKRHNFRPGETVRKMLVVLNDRRVDQEVEWTCRLRGGAQGADGPLNGKILVPVGARCDIPVAFTLPEKAGRFYIEAEFRFSEGGVQTDSFRLESHAPVKTASVAKLFLHDPNGLTSAAFDRLGIRYTPADCSRPFTNSVTLVVGRGALTRDLLCRILVPAATVYGSRILVMEQDKATLESVGFRVQEYGLRNVFPRFRDHSLAGLTEEMMRDWSGESTLVPPYLENVPECETSYNTSTWAGFTNTRVWRCRNRGCVASVIPEKPSIGDWRAIVDGGFDLQYSPLLDWVIQRGRITFCQLDVTGRTVPDPVADDLVNRLVARLGSNMPWPKWPRAIGQHAWISGRDMHIGIKQDPEAPESGVFVVSSGAQKPADFEKLIEEGGKALCLGFSAEEVAAWSPVPLGMVHTNGCVAARIENPPPELNGLSNADWSWHGTMSFDAFTGRVADGNAALRVVRHGKGVIVFWQVPPWAIDEVSRPYLRTSKRRAQAMLARLLANIGCVSCVNSVRYADVPVAEDDPYRYYRW